jgi:hypothetical protein
MAEEALPPSFGRLAEGAKVPFQDAPRMALAGEVGLPDQQRCTIFH